MEGGDYSWSSNEMLLSLDICGRIHKMERKLAADGPDHRVLLDLKSGAERLLHSIYCLTNYPLEREHRKSSTSEVMHAKSALPAISTPMPILTDSMRDTAPGHLALFPGVIKTHDTMVGKSGDEILEETIQTFVGAMIGKSEDDILEERIQTLAGAIMFKCEADVGDLARVLEAENSGNEVEVALRFGCNLELLGKDIADLLRELRETVSSFSPKSTEVLKKMITLAREPWLHGIAKLCWISEQISTLCRLDVEFDSQVKSTMLKKKSESYIASIDKEERNSGGEVAGDETTFADYRLCWERSWGNGFSFEDQTLLSPMQFTHCKPSCAPVDAVVGRTFQIYSIKVTATGFEWPINVYGVVAARDSVDRQRNPLFIRTRNYCQVLTEQDPYLKLTGPVRAVVSKDTVFIETELIRKGRKRSEDLVLASTVINSFEGDHFSTSLAENHLCRIELCFEKLEQSVQATITSVVVKSKPGSLSFQYGGKILCTSLPCSGAGDSGGVQSRHAVVFDSVDGKLIEARAGHLDLSRRVFPVELKGQLLFRIQAYSKSDSANDDAQVLFKPKKWNVSKDSCFLDGAEVEVTVAWSLIPSKTLS